MWLKLENRWLSLFQLLITPANTMWEYTNVGLTIRKIIMIKKRPKFNYQTLMDAQGESQARSNLPIENERLLTNVIYLFCRKKNIISFWNKKSESVSSGTKITAYNNITAFKFSDRDKVYMTCNIEVRTIIKTIIFQVIYLKSSGFYILTSIVFLSL